MVLLKVALLALGSGTSLGLCGTPTWIQCRYINKVKSNWLWEITFVLMDNADWNLLLCYIKQLLYDAKIYQNWTFFLFGTGFLVLWTGVHVYPTFQWRFYCCTMTCINSQYITWKTKLQAITHLSTGQETTHLQKGSWTNQDAHHVWIHTRSGLAELKGKNRHSKINPDIDPRGLHSFMKTCHSLTFTPCWNNWLLGSRSET